MAYVYGVRMEKDNIFMPHVRIREYISLDRLSLNAVACPVLRPSWPLAIHEATTEYF